MARLARYSPKGKFRLATFFLRLASDGHSTPSIYGPKLQNRWHDVTFQFCVSGYYGHYFSNFLQQIPFRFSFLDIGANIGLYSLIAANNPRCKACYAFEPNPIIFNSLMDNLVINNATSIKTYNCAISDAKGLVHFSSQDSHSGAGKLVGPDVDETTKVRCVGREMFDELTDVDRNVKVVKIDVEGHEPTVIRELMKSTIWHDIQFLYFEANDDRYDVPRLINDLTSAGLVKVHCISQGEDCNLMFARLTSCEANGPLEIDYAMS